MTIDTSNGLDYAVSGRGSGDGERNMLIIEFENTVTDEVIHEVSNVVESLADPSLEFSIRAAPSLLEADEVWLTLNGGEKSTHSDLKRKLKELDGFVSIDSDFSSTPERATLVCEN